MLRAETEVNGAQQGPDRGLRDEQEGKAEKNLLGSNRSLGEKRNHIQACHLSAEETSKILPCSFPGPRGGGGVKNEASESTGHSCGK